MLSIDLFAGAGGLTEGLRQSGFHCLYANEISKTYGETLIKNHPEVFVDTGDIREVSESNIRRALQIETGDLDVLVGGPPCQGFSVNAPLRSTLDERNHLFRDFLRFIGEFMPKVVVIENVPGMVSFEKGDTISQIFLSLADLGYRADIRILFAAHYGVPQMRWRTIIIATRLNIDPIEFFPVPSHFIEGRANFTTKYKDRSIVLERDRLRKFSQFKFVTVSDAINDLKEISNGGGEPNMFYRHAASNWFQNYCRGDLERVNNHECAGLGEVNLKRLPYIPQGGSWRDIPFDLLPQGMKRARRSDHTKRYGRLDPEGIGSTILTKCDPHWGTYIHYEQDRVLSVREAARLQSFPDKITFCGSLTEQYAQVGNAVPPLLAKAIGDRIVSVLSGDASETPWVESQMQMDV
jgi:DNA (cytosine-5)-methyltransferase 1